ncbi:hypothetical protein CQ12_28615 [Bradyrhizobium jicamae]|uniref:Polysaccharide chain length determinant N-terminal domain-containing protein n=1 Tax=Bradyrhizobium jicamae TaxID=280332 RepID=A0A0R3M4G1_9BRAD|nr:Wzz/FepE/Etk N-terminal domain-containing protein [Bradyrhizobium jicamae]KRR14833.1 hypothetical protein CQ12_28615 [Bradyrhizobium jicamae]
MLKETRQRHLQMARPMLDVEDGHVLAIPPGFGSLVRHKRLILQVTAFFVVLAVLFSLYRNDSYTAITKLLIDNKSLQLGRQDAVFARSEVDVPLIQNQIELLRSEEIANRVIDALKLIDDPEFLAASGLFGSSNALRSEEQQRRRALDSFKRRLYVGRVGDSYTLEIRFTARTPDQASNIANQIAVEYINFVASLNAKVAQSASSWLRTRMAGMGPNATVITAATAPIRKDGPSAIVVLCAAILVGSIFGITAAFAADLLDRTIRTPNQASLATGAECFGIAPLLSDQNVTFNAIRNPRSFLTHAIRRSLAAIRDQPNTKVIGVTSMLPREGKTEIAANLAQLAAATGSRVLLVDAATNSGRLSQLLAPKAQTGLVDLLAKSSSLGNVLWAVSESNLRFLPLGQMPTASASPLSSISALSHVLSEATPLFDLIIVDLPPATPMADVREAAGAFDGFLLVIEWGRTSRDVLESVMSGQEEFMQKVLGTILNKVNVRRLRTYDAALAAFFDQTKFARPANGSADSRRVTWLNAKAEKKRRGQ